MRFHTDTGIVRDFFQHVIRNSPDFALGAFFQSANCPVALSFRVKPRESNPLGSGQENKGAVDCL